MICARRSSISDLAADCSDLAADRSDLAADRSDLAADCSDLAAPIPRLVPTASVSPRANSPIAFAVVRASAMRAMIVDGLPGAT